MLCTRRGCHPNCWRQPQGHTSCLHLGRRTHLVGLLCRRQPWQQRHKLAQQLSAEFSSSSSGRGCDVQQQREQVLLRWLAGRGRLLLPLLLRQRLRRLCLHLLCLLHLLRLRFLLLLFRLCHLVSRAHCPLRLIQRHCQLSRLEQLGQAVGWHTQLACKRRHRTRRRRVQHSLVLLQRQQRGLGCLLVICCWLPLLTLAPDCRPLASLLLLRLLLLLLLLRRRRRRRRRRLLLRRRQLRRRSRCPRLLLLLLLLLLPPPPLLCLPLRLLALGRRPWSVLLLLLLCLGFVCLRRRRVRCTLQLIQRHCQLSRLEHLGQAVGRHTQLACKRRHRTRRRRVQHSLVLLLMQQRQRWRRLALCHCWHFLPALAFDCWLLAALLLLLLLLTPLLPLLALPLLVLLAASLLRCAPTANSQPGR